MSDLAVNPLTTLTNRLAMLRSGGVGGVLGTGIPRTGSASDTSSTSFDQMLADQKAASATSQASTTAARLPKTAAKAGGYASRLDWTASTDQLPANTPYASAFQSAGARYGVSPRLLAAVADVESSFTPTAVSGAGAEGLMQLMPSTASSLGVDPFEPTAAIDGAARLLRAHIDRFGSVDAALAAYNLGGTRVAQAGGTVPAAAQGYVNRVLARYTGKGR